MAPLLPDRPPHFHSDGAGGIVPRAFVSSSGALAMTLTVEAIYENGVLKPAQPLPFQEHEKVQVTVQAGASRARQTAGLLHWTGDPALLERFIMDPETPRRAHDLHGPAETRRSLI